MNLILYLIWCSKTTVSPHCWNGSDITHAVEIYKIVVGIIGWRMNRCTEWMYISR